MGSVDMRYPFYDSDDYKRKQSAHTALNWKKGIHLRQVAKEEIRKCKRDDCNEFFKAKPYSIRRFCSQKCATIFNNHFRTLSLETRTKIAKTLTGRVSPFRGKILVARLKKICLVCQKNFFTPRWQNHIYCSVRCSIHDIGSRRTSPKAARAKSGIRTNIDPTIYFYSRWEANFARILNLLHIPWQFQAKTFDLKFQKYTPDFYLPAQNMYVEIKNFLAPYSKKRDKIFRELYPNENLLLILKPDYIQLQEAFAPYIIDWEFS